MPSGRTARGAARGAARGPVGDAAAGANANTATDVLSERQLFHEIAVRAKEQRVAGYCAVLLALDEHVQQAHFAEARGPWHEKEAADVA